MDDGLSDSQTWWRDGPALAGTRFVGRKTELGLLRGICGDNVVVTLVGPPGIGKSRLARQFAQRARRAFPGGIVVTGPGDASALDPDGGPAVVVEHLASATGPVLVVLDCGGSSPETATEWALAFLARPVDVRLVVAARAPLGLPGEVLVPVEPLALSTGSAEPAVDSDAGRLFLDRARLVDPAFEGDPAIVVRLCRAVGGVPLAIEHAATLVRVLPLALIAAEAESDVFAVEDLAGTVTTPYDSLEDGYRQVADRLSPGARRLWEAVGVVEGVFSLAAARRLAGDDIPLRQLVPLLGELVDSSLLSPAEPRGYFELMPHSRSFARRHSDDGTRRALTITHGRHLRDLARDAEARWFSPEQGEVFDGVQREHDGLIATLRALADDADEGWAIGVEIVVRLRLYWLMIGGMPLARELLDGLMAHARPESAAAGEGLWLQAYIAAFAGETDVALDLVARSDRALEALQLPRHSYSDLVRAVVYLQLGDLDHAALAARDSLDRCLADDPAGHHGEAFYFGAIIAHLLGRDDEAERLGSDCMRRLEAVGSRWGQACIMWVIAIIAWKRGDLADALETATDSLRIMIDARDMAGAALSIELISWAELALGHPDRAVRLLAPAYDHDFLARNVLLTVRREQEDLMRDRLGPSAFDTLFSRNTRRGLEATARTLLGERVDPRVDDVPDERNPLTPRELEIAALIAEGLANPRIASRLVISRRTVEGHIQRMLRKLGFASRTQVAAWYARRWAASA